MLTDHDRQIRSTRIGASEVAAVLGLSPFSGPFDVWARLVHGIERPESTTLTAGRYLELAVLAWYRDKTGHPMTVAKGAVHPEHDWLSATPDAGMVYTDARGDARGCLAGAVEAKTARNRDDWGEDESDQVPVAYACQAQTQMAVAGMARCDMPVLFTQTGEFGLYVVPRDDESIAHIIATCGAWYQRHIVGKEMPPLDGGNAAAEFLRRRYPSNNGAMKTPTEAQTALVSEYRAAKGAESACKDVSSVLRQRLILEIGESDGFTLQDGEWLSFRADKRGRRSLRMSGQKDE